MMTILKDLVEKEKYEKDNDKKYAEQLRLVADELLRAAHQIENPHADEIKWVKLIECVNELADEFFKAAHQIGNPLVDEIKWFEWVSLAGS